MLLGRITSAKSVSESHFKDESMGLKIFGVERTVHDKGPAHKSSDSLRLTGELRTDSTKDLTDTDAVVSDYREAISGLRSFS